MGRLIQKDASGKWQVNGLPLEKLREGEIITKDISQRLYWCLCKLKDYEDIEMSPQRIQRWMYDLEDMVGYVGNDLCRHRHDARDQDDLDRICEGCAVSACRGGLLKLVQREVWDESNV